MDIDRSSVPGHGSVHHLRTRGGDRFALLIGTDERRHLLVYDVGRDEPTHSIPLDLDEADQLAELLHSAALSDRVARLERLINRVAGDRNVS